MSKSNLFEYDTTLSNGTPRYGSVLERLLPFRGMSSGPPSTTYKTMPCRGLRRRVAQSPSRTRPSTDYGAFIGNFFGEDLISSEIEDNQLYEQGDAFDIEGEIDEYSQTSTDEHKSSISRALGFRSSRILTFKTTPSPIKKQKYNMEQPSDVDSHSENPTRSSLTKEALCKVKTEVPFKVLDAPGLRNDFYSNVVCWSKKKDNLAVGLGAVVYTWRESIGTVPLQPLRTDLISAISYSDEDILAVGTKNGKLYVYNTGSQYVSAGTELRIGASICSIKWIPRSSKFFCGDDSGEVSLFEVDIDSMTKDVRLIKIVAFKGDDQQICGLDVNGLCDQLVIGANDNNSSLWDITDLTKPKKMFHLPHDAAVKAVAFCPWLPNFLATGGGSRDRNLRFWHTTSGTLINKYETKGQITSILWSHSHKEILLTFGFGNVNDRNGIISVFAFPRMKLKVKIDAPSDLRVLCSDISNDCGSICTAISDQSVRIYKIWDCKFELKSGSQDDSIFGSGIIDLQEGVNPSISNIR